ncbi:MAG: hypothetical protein ACYCXW_11050 [Solirubrobacteraceae bacterium]
MAALTVQWRWSRSKGQRLVLALALVLAAGAAFAAAAGAVPFAHFWALEAAGAFKGEAISGVEKFIDHLKGNLIWLGITSIGLAASVIAIMHLAGHSRAHDYAIKAFFAVAILASISGIVA